MLVNFGSLKPPSTEFAGLPSNYDGFIGSPLVGAGAFQLPGGSQTFFDRPLAQTPYTNNLTVFPYVDPLFNPADPQYYFTRPGFGPYNNPGQPGLVFDDNKIVYDNPKNFQYPENQFFDFVSAQITSAGTKVLADPTLIVQEGESSSVGVGTTYTTAVNSTTSALSGTQSCTQEKEQAGLQAEVSVQRIDDNGFITMKILPTLKAAVRPESIVCANTVYPNVFDLVVRQLKTGEFRVRDGQTLILTGVIQDVTQELTTKWPVLGDMPLIGQFFRNTVNNRTKRELVIIVTPKLLDDYQGGNYGYGYQPGTSAAKKLIYSP